MLHAPVTICTIWVREGVGREKKRETSSITTENDFLFYYQDNIIQEWLQSNWKLRNGKQCSYSKMSKYNETGEHHCFMTQPSYRQVAAVNMYINNNMDKMSSLPAGLVKAL